MLKRKFFAVALPIIAGATIVGAGFSAWVFGTQANAAENNKVGIQVTPAGDLGDIQLKVFAIADNDAGIEQRIDLSNPKTNAQFFVELDQGNRNATDYAQASDDKGISIKMTEQNTTYLVKKFETYVVDNSDKKTSIKNLTDAGFKLNLDTTIKFNEKLVGTAGYLDVNAANVWAISGIDLTDGGSVGGYKTFTSSSEVSPVIQTDKFVLTGQTTPITLDVSSTADNPTNNAHKYYKTNKVFKWKAGKKPTDTASHAAMAQALANVNDAIDIDFKLNITDPDK